MKNELTKTSKSTNVTANNSNTNALNDLFKVGKAGEDVRAAF
jgi:hypothetical protein